MRSRRWVAACLTSALLAVPFMSARAEPAAPPSASVQSIDYSQETLPNGLRVIYAPLKNAPVVQVRMLYHVGSRDERPDRQGFAHMFEHMMFRGSKHVAPQEHMKLVDEVGGVCNAFTSFDQTVYHDTVPSEDLDMALYLEADRMSSFKVTDEIYQIERKVVAQEWMLQQNKPNGNLWTDFFKAAYTTSSYQWTPIGNMQQLLEAPAAELQDFYNTYYVPNNAVLVVAGDFDVEAAKKMVQKYYAWIPAGAPVPHRSPVEPAQDSPRDVKSPDHMTRLITVVMGYHIPEYKSDEQYPLSILSAVLGEGSSSRLEKLLVSNDKPLCEGAGTLNESLEYGGLFGLEGSVLPGKNPEEVKKILAAAMADILANGVTDEELAKAKTIRRVEAIDGRQTCEDIAGELGNEALWANDPSRVNSDLTKLQAVTAADIQAVAKKYFQPNQVTVLTVQPDPTGVQGRKNQAAAKALFTGAAVAASTQPILARDVQFPADYPQHPPLPPAATKANFNKGEEATVNGVHVIVLTDHRLPIVDWTLAMRHGSHSEPADKPGLGGLTAAMLSHGSKDHSYDKLHEELESHGISVGVRDAGDNTRLSGSSTVEELDHAVALSREVLMTPTFPQEEFDKLKAQAVGGLMQSLATPSVAAEREIGKALYAGTPLNHPQTPETLEKITLDDVKKFYADFYHPNDAILIVSGDVTFDKGKEIAKTLTDGWQPKDMPAVEYNVNLKPSPRKIILIDTGDTGGGAGANVRMAIPTFPNTDDQKFAGTLANTLLSAGIESRLMEYVRAKKGYVYGVGGSFAPGRHGGSFNVSAPTRPPVAGDCCEAIFKVFEDLKNPAGDNPLKDEELGEAKRLVAGSMVMGMQTISEQAGMRLDGLLNGYPVDYYDNYAARVNAVTADQVRAVMSKYVMSDMMTIVVAAPASIVKEQLEKLGPVTVVPMPGQKDEMMK